MSETLSIADTPNAAAARSRPERATLYTLKSATLQFLQPGVLPVLALALIVGGWSYGLKLSHYFHHTDVTKASTTRMWLDHRNEATLAPAQIHQSPVKSLSQQLSVFAVPVLPHFTSQPLLDEPVSSRSFDFVSPLHPLRAPPISHLA